MKPRLSLVIPVYNEAGNIVPVLEGVMPVLAPRDSHLEIIVINDGSTDTTAAEIASAAARWPQVRELRHPTNLGQAAALMDGLNAAQGDLILAMDGDGQNDPNDFPALLALVESGQFDLACGWRVNREDTWLRRAMSRLANVVRRRVLNDGVHDSGCQLRVMRREVRAAFFPVTLFQSFIPALAVAAGFRVGEHPVTHHARTRGVAKYGLGNLWWRPAVAMISLRFRLRRRPRP
jgi:glycosyltransferase involved in cell wall biosynthesis